MKRLLRKEILRLIGLTGLGALLGWYWDKPALGAASVLALLLGQHIWQLQRLAGWLQQPDAVPPKHTSCGVRCLMGFTIISAAKKLINNSSPRSSSGFKSPAKP